MSLLACVSASACVGTETGNPSFEGQLGYDAYSSNVAAVALRQSGPEPSSHLVLVDTAWLVLGDVSFLPEGTCNAPTNELPVSATGIGEGDHAAGGHVVTSLVVDTGRYCGVSLPFERASATPISGPTPLAEHSVLIEGTLRDGSALTLASSLQTSVMLRSETSFEMSDDAGNVLIGFDLAVWLGALDLESASRNADGSIEIDDTHNPDLLAAFERALIEGTALFRDLDGSGTAIAAQRLARGE
jgi:hypothetical protein